MHNILVVDDDRLNLLIAKKFLEKKYNVEILDSGEAALDYLGENTPDLILLDIQMPSMDGFEVIKRIHARSSIPVIFLTADRTEETEEQCFEMGAIDYICKPFVPSIMLKRIKRSLELEDYRKNLEQLVESQLQRITQLEQNIIITMGNLIESRDGTTGQHVKRTSAYVEYIVAKMKESNLYVEELTPSFCENIKRAAPMHDIGKITIPDSILQKKGSLTAEEFEAMKLHTVSGGKLIKENMADLGDKEFVDMAVNIANCHHEHWDGSGYPNHLKEQEIPLCARILTIADVFDALTSDRSYKNKLSIEETITIMKNDREKIFDPDLLDVFVSDVNNLSEVYKRVSE